MDEMLALISPDLDGGSNDWLTVDGLWWKYGNPLGIDGAELGWEPKLAERRFLALYDKLRPRAVLKRSAAPAK